MCRILCLTSHDPAQRNAIILKVWAAMFGQNDGYGAAWFGADGQIGYFKRSHARIYGYDDPEDNVYETPSYVKVKRAAAYARPQFHESNDIPSDGGFLIIHGRNATSAVNVTNTHPMIMPGAAMVHNGVVQSDKYVNELAGCTCDSELLLNAYVTGGIPELEEYITGYYAFLCLQLDEDNEKTLHVIKDSKANLYCGICAGGTRAFATTEALLAVVSAEPMGEVEDDTAIIFTDKTTCTSGTFTPSVFSSTVSKETKDKVDKALGVEQPHGPLDDDDAMYAAYNGGQSQFPRKTIDPKDAPEKLLKEIDRLERAAIDDKTFELAAHS